MTDDYDPAEDGRLSYEAAIEAKRLRGDTHDWEDRPKPARDKRSFWAESNMQVAIVSYLRAALPSHYRVFSIPNGRFQASPRTIARLKAEGLTPGVWDMCILRSDGWCAWIEVKSGAGKLSPAQVEFGDWLSAGGASTAVVRSVSEAEEVLREWGVPLKARVGA